MKTRTLGDGLLAQNEHIVPIPGATKRTHLDENLAAADVTLTARDLAALSEAFPRNAAAGERYSEGGMKNVNG